MSLQKRAAPSGDVHDSLRRGVTLQREASKEFYRALNRANKAEADGKPDLAIDWCRYGASVAWWSNPGFLYCHEMEQLLTEVGRDYGKPLTNSLSAKWPPNRFLHVMTTAYETGGHTRVVARWIETCAQYAPTEQHSILISKQGDERLPAWLARATHKGGGELSRLSSTLSCLEAARELRAKSLDFDVVVLHIHPNDPLPNLAFHDQPRPVMFFNHADHVFTLGMDVARVIADYRFIGQDVSSRLRAKRPRKAIIPIPLIDDQSFPADKADARRKLGLPADALVALTIGQAYKFRPVFGYSFPEAVQAICNGDPRVIFVAIGDPESQPWGKLRQSTQGRFRSVGEVADPAILELYYSSADVYLDSFPSGSLTAALDAARHALPVQRLNIPFQPLLHSDDLALDSNLTGASSQSDYVEGVLQWLRWSDDQRSELGGRLRAAVLQEHFGASWKTKWLDVAVSALSAPCDDPVQSPLGPPQGEQDLYLGLAELGLLDRPASMFVAAAVLGLNDLPRPIRMSGLMHSFRPLLFDTVHDGRARERFLSFKDLTKTVLPKTLMTGVRKVLRPTGKRMRIDKSR
jgi:hypothetical protein